MKITDQSTIDKNFKIIDGVIACSTAVITEFFATPPQRLGSWVAQGCPKIRVGWWDLGGVIRWRLSDRGVVDSADSPTAIKAKYEAEYKRLQAESLELKNAIAKGDYIPVDEVQTTITRGLATLKRNLTGISRRVAMEIAPYADPQTVRRIEAQVAEVIRDGLEQVASGEDYRPPKKGRVAKLVDRVPDGADSAEQDNSIPVGG